MKAVVNSPGVFTDRDDVVVLYEKISREEFCDEIREGNVDSAIGHPGVAEFIAKACGVELPVNRKTIDVTKYEGVVGIKLGVRLEPGKELSDDEMRRLEREGKIVYFRMKVYVPVSTR